MAEHKSIFTQIYYLPTRRLKTIHPFIYVNWSSVILTLIIIMI